MSWISGVIDIVQDNSSAKRKQQQFGGLVLVLLLLIFCVSVYKDGFIFNAKQTNTAISFMVVSIITILLPILFYPFLFVWLFVGNILGEISSFVILGIVYYLLFFPITSVLRITNKKKTTTGWIDKKESIDYEKLY
ncbi:SxtJ family membrane protein [uncultured Aquimarina sp.]|uniref:SxtJ family membrane protein n=1 Tax=uncultured Aquimarina sp. TaxID=575652 RepID=UPI0026252DC3|nr:SxtJ family membrane protein [uncultured Aquimarina sp.]